MREAAMQTGRNGISGSQSCLRACIKQALKNVSKAGKELYTTPSDGEKQDFLKTTNAIFFILSDSRKLNLVTSRQNQSK